MGRKDSNTFRGSTQLPLLLCWQRYKHTLSTSQAERALLNL